MAEEALDKLKRMLTAALILVSPRPTEPLLLYVAEMTQVVSAAVVVERLEEGRPSSSAAGPLYQQGALREN